MCTTAISNNLILILTTRGPMPSQFKFLPTNLNVQAGRNSVFFFVLKGAISGTHLTCLCNNMFSAPS